MKNLLKLVYPQSFEGWCALAGLIAIAVIGQLGVM